MNNWPHVVEEYFNLGTPICDMMDEPGGHYGK
jgi:hypothetical protein